MPLHDYRCLACGEAFEHLQGLREPDPETSPCCGAAVERILAVPADHRRRHPRLTGRTCCGHEERCDTPPCGDGQPCCHG